MHRIQVVLAKLASTTLLAAAVMLAPGTVTMSVATAGSCPTGPVTIAKLVHVFQSGPGGLACYGGRLLTFRAFVAPLCDGCGGAEAAVISPIWLDGLLGSSVILADGPNGSQLPAFVPPALGRCSYVEKLATCPFRSYYGRWVTVSAHYDGPVAQTCRYDEHPPGSGFSRADAIFACRQELIVLSVGRLAPPDTGTVAAVDGATRSSELPWFVVFVVAATLLPYRTRRSRRQHP